VEEFGNLARDKAKSDLNTTVCPLPLLTELQAWENSGRVLNVKSNVFTVKGKWMENTVYIPQFDMIWGNLNNMPVIIWSYL
jgi:hypothetical protein